jgi:hypothetical protein
MGDDRIWSLDTTWATQIAITSSAIEKDVGGADPTEIFYLNIRVWLHEYRIAVTGL